MSFLLTYLTLFALVQKFAVHLFSISVKLVLPVAVIARSAFRGKQPGLQIKHSRKFAIKFRDLSSDSVIYENLSLGPYYWHHQVLERYVNRAQEWAEMSYILGSRRAEWLRY